MQRQNILTGIKVFSTNNDDSLFHKKTDLAQQGDEFLSIKQNAIIVKSKQNYKVFKFDCCLGKNSSQQQLYDNFCLSMVQDFVEGYDCTLIICGQNKSKSGFNQIILGKDSQETKGLIPRFIDQVTNSIKYLSQRKCLLKVSFLEINQEQMIDLLGVKKCKLQLKQEKLNKNQFYPNNLEIKPLQNIDQIQSFYLIGNRKREYAYSKSYRKKQNSTSFFTIHLESLQENATIYRKSKFTFCELSHSSFQEFQHLSDQKNLQRTFASKFSQNFEGKTFNPYSSKTLDLSDYAFQNVINTLVYGDQNANVPFRDSKVTKLLRPSLGGNHKTAILGTVDGQSQASLSKTFKILKTLQMATQIQNCPTNLRHIESDQSHFQGLSIVSLLEQIQKSSNELEIIKIDLQMLLNNPQYVSEQVNRIKDKNGHSLIKDNQFCSQQNLQDCALEEKTKKQWELKQKIKEIQKKLQESISYIQNLQKNTKNDDDDQSNKDFKSEEVIISKRKKILMRIRNVKEQRLNLMPNLQLQQIQREKKRQLFALQIEFQKQRNLYTSTIRNLQQKLSLYKKIAQNSVNSEQIEIIKTNSKYDETKRQFQIPMFMIKERKIRSGNMISPLISQRKFIVSPRSSSFNSYHSNNASKKTEKPLQIGMKNLNDTERLKSRKPQKKQIYSSEYQIEYNNPRRQQKNVRKFTDHQNQKQMTTQIFRSKFPSNGNQIKKNQTLLERVRSSEHIKNVRSEYEIEEVDINRVIKFNEQRKILKSREKQLKISKDKSMKSPINLMKRQKLSTQTLSIDGLQGENNRIGSPEKNSLPKSPLKKLKRWV